MARPQADWLERLIFAGLAAGAITALALACAIDPDPRGHGTHEQLGLPPCGLVAEYGIPCPSCGFTTTFAFSVRLRFWEALQTQPFGVLVFLGFAFAVPLGVAVGWRRFSVLHATDSWPWWRILGLTMLLYLAGWGYKLLTWPGA